MVVLLLWVTEKLSDLTRLRVSGRASQDLNPDNLVFELMPLIINYTVLRDVYRIYTDVYM